MDSEIKYDIKKNCHDLSIGKGLQDLLDSGDMVDVAIISHCKDIIRVHKIVLAINSEYFKDLLRKTSKPMTIIWFDINFSVIKAIVDYMYYGKISIEGNYISEFISAVQLLKITSLSPLVQNIDEFGIIVEIACPVIIKQEILGYFNKNIVAVNQNDKKPKDSNTDKECLADKQQALSSQYENEDYKQMGNTDTIERTLKNIHKHSLKTIKSVKKMKNLSQDKELTLAIQNLLESELNLNIDSDIPMSGDFMNDINMENDLFNMN